MDANMTTANLKHLDEASHLLSVASPAVSRYLQSIRKDSTSENGIGEQFESTSSCNACGNIMIPGWSCFDVERSPSNSSRPNRKRTRKGQSRTKDTKSIAMKCSSCNSINQSRFSKPATKQPTRPLLPTPAPEQSHTVVQEKQIDSPAPIGTKKRARGKKAGLEAMLAKSKADQPKSKGSGLDIMDFMKG